MGRSKDLATGETRFVNTSGDTMTGDLSVTGGDVTITGSSNTDATLNVLSPGWSSGAYADINIAYQPTSRKIRGHYDNGIEIFTNNTNAALKVDPNGRVTMPYQPAFLAYGVSGNTNVSGSYWIFPNAVINTGNCYSTSTGRFTAPINGNYMFFATFIGSNTNDVYRYRLRKNLGNYPVSSTQMRLDTGSTGSDYEYGTMAILMNMSAGDYASIYFESTGSTSHSSSVSGHEMFSGYLLG